MRTQPPTISVVIPAYNAAHTIGVCLDALERQTAPRSDYEVIVVDDGSSDETCALIERRPGVHLMTQAHAGPAAARNLGVECAAGNVVLFTDADCAPAADWIERMAAPFDDTEIVGAKGAYTTEQRSIVARFVQLEYEDKYDHMARDKNIDFIDTYAAAYRRDVFTANGGFDLSFPSASVEDQEFSFRLARQSFKMVFVRQATVRHLGHAESLRAYWRKKFRIGYWKVLVHKRHPDKLIQDSHTPQVLKLQILLVGAALLSVLGASFTGGARSCWGIFTLIGAAAGLLYLASTWPFVVKAWPKDHSVALAAPGLLLLRALALGSGFGVGLVVHFLPAGKK
jgi:glycosyltransferase involved in cell wall biosynthesis